jgi:hypothetical protein
VYVYVVYIFSSGYSIYCPNTFFLLRMQSVNMKPVPIPVGTLTIILYIVAISFSHIICSFNSLMKGFQENTALL